MRIDALPFWFKVTLHFLLFALIGMAARWADTQIDPYLPDLF